MEENDNPSLYRIRHSLAHVLAQAVLKQFPNAKLGFGPPTEHGFYYDFDFGDTAFTEKDLKSLEKTMKKIIGQDQAFERVECDYEGAASALASHRDEPYKQENLRNLRDRGVTDFTFYKNGTFMDVCEGPHVTSTKDLPSDGFKLDRIAGAYWLGDESKPVLTRIYALAFENRDELNRFLERRRQAEKFDHKKLGKELEIYTIQDEVGAGLPLWLPNGTVIRNEIQRYAEEMEFIYGYKRVSTPVITKSGLYETSGHLAAYRESMFPPMVIDDDGKKTEYFLRPMNCPHHHLIYSNRVRSYRELPLRLAEYGSVFRYEQSGELSGLIRVRGMTMNDAHIYLREQDFEAEFRRVMDMYLEFFQTFKLSEYSFRLSIRGDDNRDKFKGDDAMWTRAETLLEKVMRDMRLDFFVGEGEAAFYGPKIDVQFRNLMGREETVSTIQVDFLAPEKFDMKYTDEDGVERRPVIIHRAPLSTHERFISFLIEYYGGAFPTWCAPVQVMIIPVRETCHDFSSKLARRLTSDMVRVEVDLSDHSFNKKIRTHTVQKIPNLLIIGDKEVESDTVTLRRYGIEQQETMTVGGFCDALNREIKERSMLREPMGAML